MTNPYAPFEYCMQYADDYMPGAEQITSSDPATLKGLMEVWRDAANQLNATQMQLDHARGKLSAMDSRRQEAEAESSALRNQLKASEEEKKLAVQELNGFRKQSREYKGNAEKLRRHRDELAEKVKSVRAVRTKLNDRREYWEKKVNPKTNPSVYKSIVNALDEALGDSDG
ncbi:hypothetical protein [Corynebacterium flavescens]|uniref:hypothetical protein n=1 Tax=Corynebacterium flavescens TaxID=28028 RepID=UPI002647D3E3|nr:hypothetical protein [Corynebacterium flavescens]MDN6199357.1 hypothetical protein [Corynebacterium flavescens]MDN6227412.1 hypothetical protein [Corynebacterium flavescens]